MCGHVVWVVSFRRCTKSGREEILPFPSLIPLFLYLIKNPYFFIWIFGLPVVEGGKVVLCILRDFNILRGFCFLMINLYFLNGKCFASFTLHINVGWKIESPGLLQHCVSFITLSMALLECQVRLLEWLGIAWMAFSCFPAWYSHVFII